MALYKYFNYSLLSLLSRVVRSLGDMAEAERSLSSQFIAVTGTSAIVKYAAGRLDLLTTEEKTAAAEDRKTPAFSAQLGPPGLVQE